MHYAVEYTINTETNRGTLKHRFLCDAHDFIKFLFGRFINDGLTNIKIYKVDQHGVETLFEEWNKP